MSGKRFISSVVFKGTAYSSTRSAPVKAYVDHRLKEHCKDNGLDDKGAETAQVKYVVPCLITLSLLIAL
jgi:hypothetical protein